MAIFVLRVINGIHAWYPTSIEIPLKFSFDAVTQKWPTLPQIPGAGWIINTEFFPTVVAFAFFLASDVSFSLGILNFVTMAVGGTLLGMGIILDTGYIQPCPITWTLFGSYLGLALVILWVGRHYYKSVTKQAITFVRQEGVDASAPWAFRVLLIVLAAMVGMLIWVKLDWTLAILAVGGVMLTFLVMGRINAESGLFFIQARWQPLGVLIGLLGVKAFGPQGIAIVGLMCAVLTMDPRECLMPFLLNGLKMSQSTGIKPSRIGWTAPSTYLLGVAGAILVVLWASYDHGGATWDGWAFGVGPSLGPDEVQKAVNNLTVKHQLDASVDLSAWQRVVPSFLGGSAEADSKFLWAMGTGFVLVLATSFLRLRFTWWPLHPVLFLCWGTYPPAAFSASLLLGWVVKTCVTKFGGGKKYHELKPLMVGIIAGDLLGGLLFMIVGASYYAMTGRQTPIRYVIFP